MMIHLPHGGSGAKRVVKCNGCLEQAKDLPKRRAGLAARTGSMHHEVQERCRTESELPEKFLGLVYEEDGEKLIFGEDDLELAETAHELTEKILEDYDIDTFEIEPFVQWIEGVAGGSIDLLGLSADEETVLVLDYKFGLTPVPVKKSDQHFMYTVSAREDKRTVDMFTKAKRVVFAIIQPRIKGQVFIWETDFMTVNKWQKMYAKAMKGKKTKSGEWCKWCPAEATCPTRKRSIMSARLLDPKSHNSLNAAAGVVLEVEQWVKAVKEELYLHMMNGLPIDGWKIINKRATRKWLDEETAQQALKDAGIAPSDMMVSKMLTAPAMEKFLKKNKVEFDLEEFIEKVSPGTTLAPESHTSEAVVIGEVSGELAKLMEKE